MTRKELYQLYYIKKDIAEKKKELSEKEAQIDSITVDLSGMPKGQGVHDNVSKLACEIAELKAVIEEQEARRDRITEFIYSIDDVRLRMIFELKFIRKFSWRKVAFRIGGGNTADSVKKACYRYLEKK